jgi:hypothetical protein
LMGCFPLSAMALGFFPLEQGEKMWSDGSVYEWICRAPRGYFISCESALGVMTGWRALWEYQTAGFSLRMRRVFIEQCLWLPDWGFSADSVPRGRIFCVFG